MWEKPSSSGRPACLSTRHPMASPPGQDTKITHAKRVASASTVGVSVVLLRMEKKNWQTDRQTLDLTDMDRRSLSSSHPPPPFRSSSVLFVKETIPPIALHFPTTVWSFAIAAFIYNQGLSISTHHPPTHHHGPSIYTRNELHNNPSLELVLFLFAETIFDWFLSVAVFTGVALLYPRLSCLAYFPIPLSSSLYTHTHSQWVAFICNIWKVSH